MCSKTRPQWAQPKAQPKVSLSNGQKLAMCHKCSGTGLYVMEVRNGQPWSSTGLQCWSCGGTGWKIQKPRRKRCPKCGSLQHLDEDGNFPKHAFNRIADGVCRRIECEGI